MYTIEQLNALEEAIAQGALEVEYNDKRIRYRSLDEMQRIVNSMKKALGLRAKVTRVYPKHSKGLD